ncbi:uncharacterized protein LOC126910634 [Spodoptera frugiperda]|uniref:Uncharacterized protein LOC126910634 n=1 Tax=Spodoptera frugiperda TaxID=7108 RepID=A0A9R0ECW3_SPOFR|nr:uncharacterized protein LOC126910634 [Spodoptera frugiperda]
MSSKNSAVPSRKITMDLAKGPKTLREKVLKNTAKSVVSEKAARPSTTEPIMVAKACSEPDNRLSTPPQSTAATTPEFLTPEDRTRISEIVIDWEQCGISPPRKIDSEDDSSVASVESRSTQPEHGRPSILYRTPRRGTGVEMDLATQEANTLLQKGKAALEAAGNMKRECKAIAHDCLQGLYETALSLADSRSRHKFNLEKERSRHAKELVRVERAHTRELMKMTMELSLMRTDVSETKKEAKGIREWLGHETLEAFNGIKEVKEEIKAAGHQNQKEHERTRREYQSTPRDSKPDSAGTGISRLESQYTSISNQLDELRKALGRLKEDLDQPLISNDTPPEQQNQGVMMELLLTTNVFQEEMAKLSRQLQDLSNRPQASPPRPQPQINIKEVLEPIYERLEIVSSDLRVLRDKEPPTQAPAALNLEAELAVGEVRKTLHNIEKGVADLGRVEKPHGQNQGPKTFAQVASTPKPKPPQPNHTLIVSSTDPKHTGDNVIERIRTALDLKTTGARVDTVRKARNQKVVLRCASKSDLKLIKDQVRTNEGLKVQEPKPQNPLICVRGVLSSYGDAEIVDLLKAQNKHLLQTVAEEDITTLKVRYRKRARNPHECHPVLELAPGLWKCLTQAQRVHVGIKRCTVEDQSPLVQCTRCLAYGHNKTICKAAKELCSYCSGEHTVRDCRSKAEGKVPACINCKTAHRTGEDLAHTAFSEECQERQKWDGIARSRVSYC